MYQPPYRMFTQYGEQLMSTDPPIKKRLHKNHGLLQSSPISINSVKFEEEEQNWRQGSQDWQPIKIESDDEEDLRCHEQLDSKELEELFISRGQKRKFITNNSQIQCACKNQNCDTLYCKCMNMGLQCSINCNCRELQGEQEPIQIGIQRGEFHAHAESLDVKRIIVIVMLKGNIALHCANVGDAIIG